MAYVPPIALDRADFERLCMPLGNDWIKDIREQSPQAILMETDLDKAPVSLNGRRTVYATNTRTDPLVSTRLNGMITALRSDRAQHTARCISEEAACLAIDREIVKLRYELKNNHDLARSEWPRSVVKAQARRRKKQPAAPRARSKSKGPEPAPKTATTKQLHARDWRS